MICWLTLKKVVLVRSFLHRLLKLSQKRRSMAAIASRCMFGRTCEYR